MWSSKPFRHMGSDFGVRVLQVLRSIVPLRSEVSVVLMHLIQLISELAEEHQEEELQTERDSPSPEAPITITPKRRNVIFSGCWRKTVPVRFKSNAVRSTSSDVD